MTGQEWPRARRRMARAGRGSVLLLVPAGILVVAVLAALAVDLTQVHLAQRRLQAAAAAAANDAVTAGLDEALFRSTGSYELDPERVRRVVAATLAARRDPLLDGARLVVDVQPTVVTVRLVGSVRYLFAPVVPGGPRHAEVSAEATARAVVR